MHLLHSTTANYYYSPFPLSEHTAAAYCGYTTTDGSGTPGNNNRYYSSCSSSSPPSAHNSTYEYNQREEQEGKGALLFHTSAVLDNNEDIDDFKSTLGDEAELDALLDRMLDIQTCPSSYGGGESGGGGSGVIAAATAANVVTTAGAGRFYHQPHHHHHHHQHRQQQNQPPPLAVVGSEQEQPTTTTNTSTGARESVVLSFSTADRELTTTADFSSRTAASAAASNTAGRHLAEERSSAERNWTPTEQQLQHQLSSMQTGQQQHPARFSTAPTESHHHHHRSPHQSSQSASSSLYGPTFYPPLQPTGYYQYGVQQQQQQNYDAAASAFISEAQFHHQLQQHQQSQPPPLTFQDVFGSAEQSSLRPPPPSSSSATGGASGIRPLSAALHYRQKLFQFNRTISSPEMPAQPLGAAAAAVAAAAAAAAASASVASSQQSLSSSASSLYFPLPSGQLCHSSPSVDRAVSETARFPWMTSADESPYGAGYRSHVTAAGSTIFLHQKHPQHQNHHHHHHHHASGGSPSPTKSDTQSPPGSVSTIAGGSTMPLLSPFSDTSFVFHTHSGASSPPGSGIRNTADINAAGASGAIAIVSGGGGGGIQQMLCAVCGDTAACQHYGVRTCEGCKGFFKRTVQKHSKYVCLANRDCVIDKRRRNRCQYCRYQKCLNVGMVKEVVRTDSLKGRRGRLPSKSKITTGDDGAGGSGVSGSGGTAQLQPLAKALVNAFVGVGGGPGSIIDNRESSIIGRGVKENFVDSIMVGLTSVRTLVDRIPGWSSIDEVDREILLNRSELYALSLKVAYKSMHFASEQKMLTEDGLLYTLDECPPVWRPWFQSVLALSARFRSPLELDLTAFCCMCALSLVQDNTGLRDVKMVDTLKYSLINCLKEHCASSTEAKNKPQHYFSNIFSVLTELLDPICRCAKDACAASTISCISTTSAADTSADVLALPVQVAATAAAAASTSLAASSTGNCRSFFEDSFID